MPFWRYVFSFLYARHPETGAWYLSRSRCYVFASGLLLVGTALLIVSILQAPLEYINKN